MSDMPERILAWREEDEYIDHVLINKCWGETSEVPSWDATEYVRAAHIAALTAQHNAAQENIATISNLQAKTAADLLAAEAEAATLRARLAAMEGALQPFADAADESDEWGYDDDNQAPVTAGQCRDARAALTDGGKDG